jgi:prevent-host-death family protein
VSVTVGIRELRAHLSDYLARAKIGEEVIVTDRGEPIVRIQAHKRDKLAELIAQGRARPPLRAKHPIRREDLIEIDGPPWLSDVVIEGHGH